MFFVGGCIRSFVRTWTTDLADPRICSNVVSLGPINTPLASQQPADVIARIVSTVPMGRMGNPRKLLRWRCFSLELGGSGQVTAGFDLKPRQDSDDSSFVTGIELLVDGSRAQILSSVNLASLAGRDQALFSALML
jgi:NAD(P)-dependent dehydrogenase (short-subunit alcohol dehydrogenase family)